MKDRLGNIIEHATIKTEAIFDATRKYRYSVKRTWDEKKPKSVIIMVNPNFNDHLKQGPTGLNLTNYVMIKGFGSIEFVNLFAYCTKKSNELRKITEDIIGPNNNEYIKLAVENADLIILGWGDDGSIQRRNTSVLKLLPHRELYCFKLTKRNNPMYPSERLVGNLIGKELLKFKNK